MHMLLQRHTAQPPVQPEQLLLLLLPWGRRQGPELVESHHKECGHLAVQQVVPGRVQV
jgi:hypothetical protein